MNARGARPKLPLGPCPRCHRDSGMRVEEETAEPRFYVMCVDCGYTVGPYRTIGAATKLWNMEGKASV